MKRILIATDGSRSALQAVEFGLELAQEQHAEPFFVHVAPAADVLPVAGFAMAGPVSVPHELAEADRRRSPAAEVRRQRSQRSGIATVQELQRAVRGVVDTPRHRRFHQHDAVRAQ